MIYKDIFEVHSHTDYEENKSAFFKTTLSETISCKVKRAAHVCFLIPPRTSEQDREAPITSVAFLPMVMA